MEAWREILREFGPMGSALVLLAGGVSWTMWRNGRNGNGKMNGDLERRVDMPDLLMRLQGVETGLSKLETAFSNHDARNQEGRRNLHLKIEASHRELHDEIETGLREVRDAQSAGIESVRADLRSYVAQLSQRRDA